MPTVTVDGEKSFEVEAGKKLVLAIEDAGIDIMHRCGGNARCTTCRVEVLAGEATADGSTRARAAVPRNRPRAQHPSLVPDPGSERPLGSRRQPLISRRNSRRHAPARLTSFRDAHSLIAARRCLADLGTSLWRRASGITCASAARRTSCSARCVGEPVRRIANTDDTWSARNFFLRGRNGTGHLVVRSGLARRSSRSRSRFAYDSRGSRRNRDPQV